MKRLLTLFTALLALCTATAQEFRFSDDGFFKIMQLTDLHFNGKGWQSEHVPEMLTRMISHEKPDLIVITGDIIYRRPGAATMQEICGVIAAQGVPYVVTLGNHDAEQGITTAELYALIRTLPGCVNSRYNTPDQRQGDFVIPLFSKDGKRPDVRLYIMDSNSYNADDHSYKGFTDEQVAWYREQASTASPNGQKPMALLFFHVPLHEYAEAFATSPLAGVRLEAECPGRDNTGLFRTLVDSGEAIATFAGHDHSNNYIAQKEGIALCYGHYSGGYGEYQELVSGSRLILLQEGQRGFDTWVRLANLREKWRTTFPTKE